MKHMRNALHAGALLLAACLPALGQQPAPAQQLLPAPQQAAPAQQRAAPAQQQAAIPRGRSYDYCVACTAPQAIYLCTVGPRQPDPGARVWGSFCAERVRADVGHSHCSSQTFTESCKPTRAFVFRGTQANERQVEALTSAEPERRANAAEQIWQTTLNNVRAVGEGVGVGAQGVGRGAGAVWDGMVDIGGGVVRGAGCVFTLGQRC